MHNVDLGRLNGICPSCDIRYYDPNGSTIWIDIKLCADCSQTYSKDPERRMVQKKVDSNDYEPRMGPKAIRPLKFHLTSSGK